MTRYVGSYRAGLNEQHYKLFLFILQQNVIILLRSAATIESY